MYTWKPSQSGPRGSRAPTTCFHRHLCWSDPGSSGNCKAGQRTLAATMVQLKDMDVSRLKQQVDLRLNEGRTMDQIAAALGVTRSALERKLKKHPAWRGVVCKCSVEEAMQLILDHCPMNAEGGMWGIRTVWQHMKSLGIRMPRDQVGVALKRITPDMCDLRATSVIPRGLYNHMRAMWSWHIDSWDKLVTYNIRVHACIDGGTRYIVYAEVATNKKQDTLYAIFLRGVQRWGRPLRVRADGAPEHCLIRDDMNENRSWVRRPWLQGRSVHNQRIESWWRQMKEKWGGFAMAEIGSLKDDREWFVPGSRWHIASLHAVWLPYLRAGLDRFVMIWNHHRIRKQNRGGVIIPSSVPATTFQELERLEGTVGPPPWNAVEPADNTGHEWLLVGDPRLPEDTGEDVFPPEDREEDAIPDWDGVYPFMPPEFLAARDAAYSVAKLSKSGNLDRYKCHLTLSRVCRGAMESNMTLQEYVAEQYHPLKLREAVGIYRTMFEASADNGFDIYAAALEEQAGDDEYELNFNLDLDNYGQDGVNYFA